MRPVVELRKVTMHMRTIHIKVGDRMGRLDLEQEEVQITQSEFSHFVETILKSWAQDGLKKHIVYLICCYMQPLQLWQAALPLPFAYYARAIIVGLA